MAGKFVPTPGFEANEVNNAIQAARPRRFNSEPSIYADAVRAAEIEQWEYEYHIIDGQIIDRQVRQSNLRNTSPGCLGRMIVRLLQ